MQSFENHHLLSLSQIKAATQNYVLNTYGRLDVAFVKGVGCYVWDSEGNKYLDLLAGIAVNALGYAHPVMLDVINAQTATLIHTSNLFFNPVQAELAQILVENSFADKVFFCNSGAEANEAAIKLARRYGVTQKHPECFEIITMENSFHGRTMATLTATGQAKVKQNFGALLPGFKHVPYDDLVALRAAISSNTVAVMLEPIQGEGGVRIPSSGYLASVRQLCDENNLLLIFDEVQTGMGRTGKLFAYEHDNVKPDIMSLAKALGGGFPIGACLVSDKVASVFAPGDHASTFGGNFLGAAIAKTVLQLIVQPDFMQHINSVGEYFLNELKAKLATNIKTVNRVWGRGLMIGIELTQAIPDIVQRALKAGLIINCTQGNILRLVPPLIITKAEVDEAVAILQKILL